jgi:hypothetical protein
MTLLEINWWMKAPIDFEHKKWKFLAYLKRLDEAFYDGKFSPWLLHSEKMVEDMKHSKSIIIETNKILTNKKLVFIEDKVYYETEKPNNEDINVYVDILDYSIPLLDNKVEFGKRLWEDDKKFLY